jgi:hypothetical protein
MAEYDIIVDGNITWVWHRKFDIPEIQKTKSAAVLIFLNFSSSLVV